MARGWPVGLLCGWAGCAASGVVEVEGAPHSWDEDAPTSSSAAPAPPPMDLAPAPRITSPDWDSVVAYAESGVQVDGTAALTALSTAWTEDATRCSGFMISKDLFVTARHCHHKDTKMLHVQFGQTDTKEEQVFVLDLIAQRLAGLGVIDDSLDMADTVITPSSIDPKYGGERRRSWFHHRRCFFEANEPRRDISYWRCERSDHTSKDILTPNHVGEAWGYLELGDGLPERRAAALGYQVNRRCDMKNTELLISPGVIGVRDTCAYGWRRCFQFDGDVMGGSSGGPIVDGRHRVFGVIQGAIQGRKESDGKLATWEEMDDPCRRFDDWNLGAELGDVAKRLLEADAAPGVPQGKHLGRTRSMGKWTPHQAESWTCPDHMQGIGVIGTTDLQRRSVGNLALLCSPTTHFPYDQTVVFGGGSEDIGGVVAKGTSLNAYLSRARIRRPGTPRLGMQAFAVCRPDTTLVGLVTRPSEEGLPGGVSSLLCQDNQSGEFDHVPVGGRYQGTVGQHQTGMPTLLACDKGSNLYGMHVVQAAGLEYLTGLCREAVPL